MDNPNCASRLKPSQACRACRPKPQFLQRYSIVTHLDMAALHAPILYRLRNSVKHEKTPH